MRRRWCRRCCRTGRPAFWSVAPSCWDSRSSDPSLYLVTPESLATQLQSRCLQKRTSAESRTEELTGPRQHPWVAPKWTLETPRCPAGIYRTGGKLMGNERKWECPGWHLAARWGPWWRSGCGGWPCRTPPCPPRRRPRRRSGRCSLWCPSPPPGSGAPSSCDASSRSAEPSLQREGEMSKLLLIDSHVLFGF